MEILKAKQIIGLVGADRVAPARVVLSPRDGKFADMGKYMTNIPAAVQLSFDQMAEWLEPKEEVLPSAETSRQGKPSGLVERIRFAMSDLISQRRV